MEVEMAEEHIPEAISAISIKGFKSFFDEQRIEIRFPRKKRAKK
jgi:hypothetical protein